MASRRSVAGRPLLAIAGLLATLAGKPAFAEDDPFALPTGLTAAAVDRAPQTALLSELEVNGDIRPRLIAVTGNGNDVAIPVEEARAAGLPVPASATGAIRLADLPVYKWSFDGLRQRLAIQLFRNNDGANFRDLSKRAWAQAESVPLTAIRVDYDLSGTLAERGSRLGGLIETSVVRGGLQFVHSMRLGSGGEPGSPFALRLDSFAQWAVPRHSMVVTAGDFISAGSQSQRAIRLGGLQVASNFSLRPDLVTSPLPQFSGNVAVPTNVDILAGDRRYTVGELDPGAFTLRNVPSNEGRGEFAVITRDALGRDQIETTRFYVSRELLVPGTTGYAINAGFVRRQYGRVSNDYGPLVASAFLRRGVSPFLTAEVSGEGTAGTLNLGARGVFTIGNLFLVNAEGRYSRDKDAGSGKLVSLAVETLGDRLSARAGAIIPSPNYRDVASRLGDTLPARQYYADMSWRLRSGTLLQLAYLRQYRAEDFRIGNPAMRSQVASASFRTAVSSWIDLFAAGGFRRGDSRGLFASVGISMNLGSSRHLGLFGGIEANRPSAGITYTKDDVKDGDIGYRLAADIAPDYRRFTGVVGWRNRHVRVEGLGEYAGGRPAGRINASGTVLVAGGAVYARNQSGGSYAMVRTGQVGGVAIKLENRLVGMSDRAGRLLIQGLPAQVPVHVDIDTERLPSDALVRRARKVVSAPDRAVILVDMDVRRFRPVLRRIIDSQGRPLEAGLPATAFPSGDKLLTGYEGMIEINSAGGDDLIMVGIAETNCEVVLLASFRDDDVAQPLVCRPSDHASPDDKVALRN